VINETLAKKIWETPSSKYLTKSIENHLHLKRRLCHFQLKRETSISKHVNIYTKLLANLTNLTVVIDDEDKLLILLSSLADEGYDIFVLIVINRIASLSYKEMTTALVNLEKRRKNKEYSTNNTSAEVDRERKYSKPEKRKLPEI